LPAPTAADRDFDPRWHGAVINSDRWHFHRRLLERYGIVLGPADYSRIARSIADGRAPLVRSGPDNTAVYLVQIPSTGALVFVGTKANGELVTAMSVSDRLLALVQLRKGCLRQHQITARLASNRRVKKRPAQTT
jgi:hypothetical protein